VAQVQATIENVPQNPGTAFTVSGNTITFDGAPASGTNNIYVYYTSPITQVIQPGQGTVGTAQIVDNAITTAKIAAGAVIPADLSTGGPVWISTGDTTIQGNLYIADDNKALVFGPTTTSYIIGSSVNNNQRFITNSVERMRINSSGQITIPSQPAFSASLSTNQSITGATNTKLNYNSVEFNTGGHFNTANNRFTAPVTGRYLITITNNYTSSAQVHSNIFVNGGNVNDGWSDSGTGTANSQTRILALNANDYVEGYAYVNTNNTLASNRCKLAGYLIG
jgi:hypothetical protein